jgi:hypothetical protein
MRLKGATWFIKGDISKCFDHIDFNVLMSILEEKVKDRRFTGLIWKALKAGHFNYFRNDYKDATMLENHGIRSLPSDAGNRSCGENYQIPGTP